MAKTNITKALHDDRIRVALAHAQGRRPGPPPRQPLMSEADIAKAQRLLQERLARKARG